MIQRWADKNFLLLYAYNMAKSNRRHSVQ